VLIEMLVPRCRRRYWSTHVTILTDGS